MSKKYYVVWIGRRPGIYETWDECEAQVKGFKRAKFKSFKNLNEADATFLGGEENYLEAMAIDDKPIVDDSSDLPGWKADEEYPPHIQEILRKIRK